MTGKPKFQGVIIWIALGCAQTKSNGKIAMPPSRKINKKMENPRLSGKNETGGRDGMLIT